MTGATTDEALTLVTSRAGQRLRALVPGQTATLIAFDAIYAGLFEVLFCDDSGRSGAHAITDADAARFDIAGDFDSDPAYDADPDELRLAAETLRIKYTALYDPMVADHSSDDDPLPHQIGTVYGVLLPRIAVRFLLADDPGAGNRIMARLYLEELILRSDYDRVIIDSDRYSRDIGNVTRVIIVRLSGAGARSEIIIDIQATKPEGSDEAVVRTISENAHVLRFDASSGFGKTRGRRACI